MPSIINEKAFEVIIEESLLKSGGYVKRKLSWLSDNETFQVPE